MFISEEGSNTERSEVKWLPGDDNSSQHASGWIRTPDGAYLDRRFAQNVLIRKKVHRYWQISMLRPLLKFLQSHPPGVIFRMCSAFKTRGFFLVTELWLKPVPVAAHQSCLYTLIIPEEHDESNPMTWRTFISNSCSWFGSLYEFSSLGSRRNSDCDGFLQTT
jgi:hypothetical protein